MRFKILQLKFDMNKCWKVGEFTWKNIRVLIKDEMGTKKIDKINVCVRGGVANHLERERKEKNKKRKTRKLDKSQEI